MTLGSFREEIIQVEEAKKGKQGRYDGEGRERRDRNR